MFRFKAFTIQQDRCAMKVGTDGVLLGAAARLDGLPAQPHILDIGTGTGLLALMLAQRLSAMPNVINFEIDAIEITADAAQQAAQNIATSPWAAQIKVKNTPIQLWETNDLYHLIVSNPPYFSQSLTQKELKEAAKNTARQLARHNDALSPSDFLTKSKQLLHTEGRLCMILPYYGADDFIQKAENIGLQCSHKTVVYGRAGKPAERILFTFVHSDFINNVNNVTGYFIENELIIYGEGQKYTDDYIALTKDFYL